MMTRLTSDELERGLGDVIYELLMMNYTARELMKIGNVNTYNKICILESFLVHIRCLFDFFFTQPKYSSDVAAVDYLEKEEAKYIGGNVVNKVIDINKINKLLAHVTTDRAKLDPNWPVKSYELHVNSIARIFINIIRKKYSNIIGQYESFYKQEYPESRYLFSNFL